MATRVLARAAAGLALASCAVAQTIRAPHQLHVVDGGEEVLFGLAGHGKTGLAANVGALPAEGALHQISKVFSNYGYEPKAGDAVTAAPAAVVGTANRLVYTAPPSSGTGSEGAWDVVEYTVTDGAKTSTTGLVTFVPPSGALVSSSFGTGVEGWTVTGNRVSELHHETGSRGADLAQYVYATDDTIDLDDGGVDKSPWYFEAPSKFHGHRGIAYRGTFKFTLSAFTGDLANHAVSGDTHFVILECAQCAVNAGITLALPLAAAGGFDGSATQFALPLHEGAGWLKDPKNTLTAWAAPTQCEMIEVLSGLSGVRILGDVTSWYESIALDGVMISQTVAAVPVCAQGSTDASKCTCAAAAPELAAASTFFSVSSADSFGSIGEAVIRARALGLRGYHAVTLYGATKYMPGPTRAAYEAAVAGGAAGSSAAAADDASTYGKVLSRAAGSSHPSVATSRYTTGAVTGNSAAVKAAALYV